MIKVTNVDTWGFTHAVRGMRNPMNSWHKSDSHAEYPKYVIGENDLDLMHRLYVAGSEHRKYLRQIFVSMDIIAPLYFYLEFDTYKIGVTSNSCSKMHKLLSKPFEISDFSFDRLAGYKNEIKYFRPIVDENGEAWKQFQDTDYLISSEGRVKHNNRVLAGSVHKDGYIFFTIKNKQYPAHRLVANAFIENTENKPFINHIDANKMNNKKSNLEWVTQKENVEHAKKNHLQPIATTTYKGKFSKEQRIQIKEEWNSGIYSKRQLAKKYNVSHTCICDIVNDKYKYSDKINSFEECAKVLIDKLNELRDMWLRESDVEKKKQIWYSILQLLPSSYNQRRTVTMTYENVVNIIHQRKNHKLDEWREFVKTLMGLPYIREIIGEGITCEQEK